MPEDYPPLTGGDGGTSLTSPRPYLDLLIGCLVFILVCIIGYMCLQAIRSRSRSRSRGSGRQDRFCGGGAAGGCGPGPGPLDEARNMSHAVTCGVMPSIETTCGSGNGNCCGVYGVPI